MKKNKVGILTYQNAINYGAILQTYALNHYINLLGIECDTINYNCKKIDSSYKLIKIDLKDLKGTVNSLLNIPVNIIRKYKFRKFKNSYIKFSNKKYDKDNIECLNYIYNIFITGSDQVWNYNGNKDENYYLKFVNCKNTRASYAASFGNINIFDEKKDLINNE